VYPSWNRYRTSGVQKESFTGIIDSKGGKLVKKACRQLTRYEIALLISSCCHATLRNAVAKLSPLLIEKHFIESSTAFA
jgi:hypothetical protein